MSDLSIKILTDDSIICEQAPEKKVVFRNAQGRAIYFYFLYRKIANLGSISIECLKNPNVIAVLSEIHAEMPNIKGGFSFPTQINSSISSIKKKFKDTFPNELFELCHIQPQNKGIIRFYEIYLSISQINWEEYSSFGLFMKKKGF